MSDPQTISLSPAIVHIDDLMQNNTLSFVVSITDANNDPVDISGDDFEMEIRTSDDTLVMALGIGNGIEFTDPGKIYVEIDYADTVGLDPDKTYTYEVVWIFSGYRRSVAFGNIEVKKRVVGL